MGLLTWTLVGLITGWLAGLIIKGSDQAVLGDIFLGITGALAGGYAAGTLFDVANPTGVLDLTTLAVAFLGAVVTVALVRALPGRSPV